MVYLSDKAILNIFNYCHLLFIAQITSTAGSVIDTLSGNEISANYMAIGNEKYIFIGSFKPDSSTAAPLINLSSQLITAYAYINNVSLNICTGLYDPEPHKSLNIFPNPCSDHLNI